MKNYWDPDDELQFTHDGTRVIIITKTKRTSNEIGFTPEAEILNARLAMMGFSCCRCHHHRTSHPRSLVMLVLAATLVGCLYYGQSSFADEVDDEDDGPGGGMMIPVPTP